MAVQAYYEKNLIKAVVSSHDLAQGLEPALTCSLRIAKVVLHLNRCVFPPKSRSNKCHVIWQIFYLLIFKPFKRKTVSNFFCEVLQALPMLLRSFQVESIILNMEVSGLCFFKFGVWWWPRCSGVWTIAPQHPGFRNRACLMRAFTLPVGVLHISTVL